MTASAWLRWRLNGRIYRPLCLLVCSLALAANGQSLDRPARIIVPLAAGSTSDLIARLLAENIFVTTGRSIIVENKPGASGRVAIASLKQATPDGTTLLMAPIALPVLIPLTAKNVDYDPAVDLVPVAQVAEYAVALAVRFDHPARTVREYVAWARANPAQASLGSPGAGSLPHLLGIMLSQAAGIDLIHVAYQSAPPLERDIVGGQVASGTSALSDFIELHRTGKLRILGTSGVSRSTLVPEVATFKEQGFVNVEGTGWTAVVAPAGTPKAVIDRWSSLIVTALHTPALRAKLVQLGVEPTGTTPEALAAIIRADTARWTPVIKAADFKVE